MRHALLSVVSLDLSQIGNTVLCFLKCECQYCAFFNLWNAEITGVLPVSYTHLDVYKRQVEQELLINADSGFYKDGLEAAGYTVLGITLAVMLILLIYGSTRKKYPVAAPVKSRPVFIMSLVMACLLYTSRCV